MSYPLLFCLLLEIFLVWIIIKTNFRVIIRRLAFLILIFVIVWVDSGLLLVALLMSIPISSLIVSLIGLLTVVLR